MKIEYTTERFTTERIAQIKQFILDELEDIDLWDERHWAGEHDFDICFDRDGPLTISLYRTYTDKDGDIVPSTREWCDIPVADILSNNPLQLDDGWMVETTKENI